MITTDTTLPTTLSLYHVKFFVVSSAKCIYVTVQLQSLVGFLNEPMTLKQASQSNYLL